MEATKTSEAIKVIKPESYEHLEQVVRQTLVRTLMLKDVKPEDIAAEKEEFLMDLGCTSIDALELIVTMEELVGIEFQDNELDSALVRTLRHFVDVIAGKLGLAVRASASGATA